MSKAGSVEKPALDRPLSSKKTPQNVEWGRKK